MDPYGGPHYQLTQLSYDDMSLGIPNFDGRRCFVAKNA